MLNEFTIKFPLFLQARNMVEVVDFIGGMISLLYINVEVTETKEVPKGVIPHATFSRFSERHGDLSKLKIYKITPR